MDGKGNISVNAPNDMNITVGKNFNISVGENMNTNVGNDNTTNIGNDNTLKVTEIYKLTTNEYNQIVQENKSVKIIGDLDEITSTTTHKATGGDILIQSAGVTTILGLIDAKVNKG